MSVVVEAVPVVLFPAASVIIALMVITSPSDIGERDITDEQGKIFEETLGKAILEIIEEQHIGNDEDRNNNIKESVTE